MREAGLNCGYFKPVLSGVVEKDGKLKESDCNFVVNTAKIPTTADDCVVYWWSEAVSPHLAAKRAGEDIDIDSIIDQAVNNILLMKILPRIEGDADMFAISNDFKKENGITYDNRLEWLMALAPDNEGAKPDGENEDTSASKNEEQATARNRIKEMIDRLNNQEFTRFWP